MAMWYRVEFDAAGGRVSCELVRHVLPNNGVFFVQATDVEAAWRKAHSLRVAELQRLRGAARKAEGKCPRCGIGSYDGTTRCAEYCKPEAVKRDRNKRTVGAATPKTQVRELEPHLSHMERARLEVLKECLVAWRSPRNFLAWITAEIDALSAKLRKAS